MISDNSSQSSRITLVDKDRIISDDRKFPKTFDTSFENAVGNLNIKDVINSPEVNSTSTGINIYILFCVNKERISVLNMLFCHLLKSANCPLTRKNMPDLFFWTYEKRLIQ